MNYMVYGIAYKVSQNLCYQSWLLFTLTQIKRNLITITGLLGKFTVWSPRNRRLAILLLYQALGNARISLSRRISYLNEADPISQTADTEIKFVRAHNKHPELLTLYMVVIRQIVIILTVLTHKIPRYIVSNKWFYVFKLHKQYIARSLALCPFLGEVAR